MPPIINICILGARKTRPTGKLLAAVTQGDYVEDFVDASNEYQIIWRWGNFYTELPEEVMVNTSHILNKPIGIFRNKAEQRIRLIHHGVLCPPLYNSATIESASFPVIARPVFHRGGRDFHLARNKEDAMRFLSRGYYLQKIIQTREEYRLFVFKGRVLEANLKILSREPRNPLHPLIKNFRNGYSFRIRTVRGLNPELKDTAREAVRHVGLDFAGVDCGIGEDNRVYIFEVNSAPALIPRKAAKICKRMLELLGYNSSQITIDTRSDSDPEPMEEEEDLTPEENVDQVLEDVRLRFTDEQRAELRSLFHAYSGVSTSYDNSTE